MNKKHVYLTAFILLLMLSVVAGTLVVNLAVANPFIHGGEVPTPEGTEPPIITFFSPRNNTVHAPDGIAFSFSAGISKDTNYLSLIYYETDWQKGNTTLYRFNGNFITEFPYNKTLPVTEGYHRITVSAVAIGSYFKGLTVYSYKIDSSSSIDFSVDGISPSVSILSPQNITYAKSDVRLNFTVNEPTLGVFYNLDEKGNVTFFGNTTLRELIVGSHSLRIYAKDIAGNMGASETIYFTVALQPSGFLGSGLPAEYGYGIVSIIAMAIVASVVLVYFIKNKRDVRISHSYRRRQA